MGDRTEGLFALIGSRNFWSLAMARREGAASGLVRDAGPENMNLPPSDWDDVDARSDASFPASDPPGRY